MARPLPQRGEVWIADLGYAAKRRPCLILSIPIEDRDRVAGDVCAGNNKSFWIEI
jgi:hypothetical protein